MVAAGVSPGSICSECGANLIETRAVHNPDCAKVQAQLQLTPTPKVVSSRAPRYDPVKAITELREPSPKAPRGQVKFWGEVFHVSSKYVILHVHVTRSRLPDASCGRIVIDRDTWKLGAADGLGFEIRDPLNVLRWLDEPPESAPVFGKNPDYPDPQPKAE